MRRRHGILLRFLTEILKIEPETADSEACKMEHALSSGTLESLIDFMDFIQACPRAGESWLQYFEDYRRCGKHPETCRSCCDGFPNELERRIKSMETDES